MIPCFGYLITQYTIRVKKSSSFVLVPKYQNPIISVQSIRSSLKISLAPWVVKSINLDLHQKSLENYKPHRHNQMLLNEKQDDENNKWIQRAVQVAN